MLKHVVMWKIFEEEKEENIKIIKEKLENLKKVIEQIEFLEVGCNVCLAPVASDFILTTHFKGEEELNIYRSHPEHVKVAEFIKTVASDRSVVDYFID